MNCPYCDLPEGHTADCPKRERYQPPRRVKRYSITAKMDDECSAGRRRESKEELR